VNRVPDIAYDDEQHPVASVGFAYPDEPEPQPAQDRESDILRHGLILILRDGKRAGMASRAAALAMLAGLFPCQADAARAAGLSPSAMSRAVEKLRSELAASLTRTQHAKADYTQ